ncbi:thermonuclease family protein [Candidatus Nanohalococcus occultus]|uniref:Micrococcal nuclease n=1 Tax=Candidatus Nanohalococcus occultus TaxID=2978047 RepID=A0ABY8CL54_9ARCH|nr:Micrococcal nuclease [Candidatus Nanohaloarchaeota archaeon SVXNc]
MASGCIASQEATVVDVADGDTVDVRFNGSVETVRLIGVDTPEIHTEVSPEEFNVPDTEEGRRCLSNWAEKASRKAKKLEAQEVRLAHNGERGTYGRLLGYLYVENRSTSFNYMLVEEGYARVYESRFKQRSLFLEAQTRAKLNNRGVWSCN